MSLRPKKTLGWYIDSLYWIMHHPSTRLEEYMIAVFLLYGSTNSISKSDGCNGICSFFFFLNAIWLALLMGKHSYYISNQRFRIKPVGLSTRIQKHFLTKDGIRSILLYPVSTYGAGVERNHARKILHLLKRRSFSFFQFVGSSTW